MEENKHCKINFHVETVKFICVLRNQIKADSPAGSLDGFNY